jgi:glycerate 2-kinase
MIIKNKNKLSITALREQVLDIVEAGISRVLPSTVMKYSLKINPSKKILSIEDKEYDISKGRIFVIGGGKASGLMAQTLEEIIGPGNITRGIVNCNSTNYQTNKIKIVEASHPTPDQRGVRGVEQMLGLRDQYSINKNDLVICLISGGGSALMPCPVDEITLKDKQQITKLLIERGPTIQEINAVRKHLSKIKGGQLGKFFSPGPVISLIISDVIGNDLDAIASGPTVPDSSTFLDAYQVLKKYQLLDEAPPVIVDFLGKGCAGKIAETPKKLDNCRNCIIGDNKLALKAMAAKAEKLGLKPYIVTTEQKGDPTEMAKLRAKEILNSKYKNYDVILIGGETTPKLPGNHGKGGRNQHYAALSMLALKEYPGEWVMTSIGTDGSDYLPDIAGAIIDNNSLTTSGASEITIQSYLDRYDSSTLLEKIGNSLIKTGNTGTNVGDATVYIFIASGGHGGAFRENCPPGPPAKAFY